MSFLGFFRRRPPASTGTVDPEGWQAGDQAECVVSGHWYQWPSLIPASGPQYGQVLKVLEVKEVADTSEPTGRALSLAFSAYPGKRFASVCFRKVRPRADEATPAEEAFTHLVRRAPTPAPAPVHLPDQPKIEEFQ